MNNEDLGKEVVELLKKISAQEKREGKKMAHFGFRFRAKFLKSSDSDAAAKAISEILKKYECFYKIVKI